MSYEKEIRWQGSSKKDLMSFPEPVVKKMAAGLQLLQLGERPYDSKPIKDLDKGVNGVYEIRVGFDGDAYRTMYVSKLEGVIGVLHCFEKKSQKTSKKDLATTVRRYKELKKEVNEHDKKVKR